MQVKKLVSLMLGTVTAIAGSLSTASGALADNLASGVAIPGGSYKATSVALPRNPVFPSFNYPTYLLNTLKTGKFGCGENFPAIDHGVLSSSVGNFRDFEIYYDVPNLGPAADSGLYFVIQTSDGFTRIASKNAILHFTANGFNSWRIILLPSDFSPSFSENQTVLQTVSARYNGSVGPIYMYFPFVLGSDGVLTYLDFSYKTNPDFRFNNN